MGENTLSEFAGKDFGNSLPVKIVWLCGGTTADITPKQPLKFNMVEAQERMKKQHCKIRMKSQMATIFNYGKFEISLFDGGRILMKNVTDEKSTMKAYREILHLLNIIL